MSISALMHPPLHRRRGTLALAACLVAAEVLLAAALVRQPLSITAMTLGAAIFVLCLWQPRVVYAGVFLTLAFVPVYASPKMGPLNLEPTVCGMWLIAGAVALRAVVLGRHLYFGLIDAAVMTMAFFLGLTFVLGTTERADLLQILFLWLGPYLATRLVLQQEADARFLLLVITATAVLAVPWTVLEGATGWNPFQALSVGGADSEVWGTGQTRLGADRAEGAFGHSIALSMFFATALIASLGLAITDSRSQRRLLWWSAAAAIGTAMIFTVSRTGWLVTGAGVLLMALLITQARARLRLAAAMGGILALALVWSQLPVDAPSPLEVMTTKETTRSSDHRIALLEAAQQPRAFELFGPADDPLTALAYTADNESVDNAFLAFGSGWGLGALIGLVLVLLAVVASTVRLRGSPLRLVVVAATLANFVGLWVVAFITQQQIYIWALVGACAALSGHTKPAPTSTNQDIPVATRALRGRSPR